MRVVIVVAALLLAPRLSIAEEPAAPPAPTAPTAPTFLGAPDDELIAKLCAQPIAKLTWNPMGTTIKFKVTLADGTRGSLRPAQQSEAGNHRADVAAYRLSRAMGLGKVAPACMRTVPKAVLLEAAAAAAGGAARLEREIAWSAGGSEVEASVVAWVDKVRSAELEKDLAAWRALLSQSRALDGESEVLRAHAAEGSRILAFDYLIDNWDRWSGSNTFRVGKDGPFVWLDNAAGFGHYAGAAVRRNEKQLDGVERFSRSLVSALQKLDEAHIGEALKAVGLRPVSIRHVVQRRAWLLKRIDALVAQHGEAKVLCFE